MDKLNMDLTLEPVLANICQQLANFFGTTTETVIDNAPEFLAKYGWFSMLSDLGADIILTSFLLLLGGLLIGIIILFINEEILYNKEYKLNPMKWGIGIAVAGIILDIFSRILPCIIAPEFVGLKHLLRLFDIYI